jgi:hypothetical protein
MKHLLAGVSAAALLAASPAVAWADGSECLLGSVDIFLNPFSKDSAHHRPIGSGAVFAGSDHPSTLDLKKSGFGNLNSDNGYGINVYKSGAGEPARTVTHGGPYPDSDFPVTLHVPVGADNHGTTDATVVVHDTTTGKTHEFYYWRWSGGHPTAAIHHQWDIREEGHSGSRTGASASGVAGLFGLLRGFETNTPGCAIQHVLQLSLPSRPDHVAQMLSKEVVWPATSADTGAASPGRNNGHIPYGGLLALPPSVDIDGLRLSEPGRRVAEALQNYGAYVVDESEIPTLRGDQDISGPIQRQLIADMQKIWPQLRLVLNNAPDGVASGGGLPCAENAAFDSPGVDKAAECSGKEPPSVTPPPSPPGSQTPKPQPPADDESPRVPPVHVDPPGGDPINPPVKNEPPVLIGPPVTTPPAENDPPAWKEKMAEWMWKNLPRTSEGLQFFRKWLDHWF